uniref:Carbohydrate esterase family 16 protein n=1 Tax=Ganoderma boninense TaxID=34458 RepID=A0A5K1JZC0_9APHY|nr:Uncharacterized protein [Ganoderma boninense]
MKALLSTIFLLSSLLSATASRARDVDSPQHVLSPPQVDRNNGIHLAVSPACGPLSGAVSDVNAGINLKRIKTIVAFGDSYTDGGRTDGGPLAPPVVTPPDAGAGGRSTDGKVWVENLADDIGATLMDYACRDYAFVRTFLGQSNTLDPNSTLYVIFFGINDFGDSRSDGEANLQAAAQVILSQIRILASAPTNARNILLADVYGLGTHTPAGDAMVQTVFSGLYDLHRGVNSTGHGEGVNGQAPGPALNVAFSQFSTIWDGVFGEPGYEAFGYVSTEACIRICCVTTGMCDDPEHYFYYIPNHPSKEGMRIMADYAEEVLERCAEA